MITVRRSDERGHFDFGWLDTRHTFSFGDYYDERQMGFRSLRVINEDRVAADQGFPTHGHRDMEIVTVILDGTLEHKDSMDNGSVIRPGEVQRMTAGSGVLHSEYNPSPEKGVHFMQIWIHPSAKGLKPGYEQKAFDLDRPVTLLASPDGSDGSVTVHQDVRLYRVHLAGEEQVLPLPAGRHAWVQVLKGTVALNDIELAVGDGAAVSDEDSLRLRSVDADILVFDLA